MEGLIDSIINFGDVIICYIKSILKDTDAELVNLPRKKLLKISSFLLLQANCAVCQADDSGATTLSSNPASRDLYGTQCIGFYGKIRSWKSVSSILVD